MPVLSLACHLPHNTPNIPSRYNNEQTTKQTKAINNSYIYISYVNVTQTVPDISPLMPMHQDPLLVSLCEENLPVTCGSPHKGIMWSYLTLNVWGGPCYLGLTKSISWLLLPWLLTSPGHQQPWSWQCRICRSWSYLKKDYKYLWHINME